MARSVHFKQKGDLRNLNSFLKKMSQGSLFEQLEPLAQKGTDALSAATPQDTGLASTSWYHEISVGPKNALITWKNSDVENGFPVAIMLQLGYATGTGGYVAGRDYINPALKPIFDDILNQVWKAVTSA